MKNTKLWIIIGFIIAALALSFGIIWFTGNNDKNKPIDPSTITEEVEITFWHGVDAAQEEELQRLADEFNAQWEGTFHVTLVQQAGSYDEIQQKITLSENPDDLPTMALGELWWMQDQTEKLVPLDDYISDPTVGMDNYSDIAESFTAGMEIDGTTYAMPYAKSTEVLYVNDNLEAEAGVTTPTTWEELYANAQIIKDTTGKYGFLPGDVATFFVNQTMQNDAYYYQDGQVNLNTETANAIITQYAECFATEACRLTTPDPYASYPFSYGDVAYLEDTTSAYPFMYPDGFNFSVHTVPGGKSPIQGQDILIFSGHSNEEVAGAWEFTKFLMQPENMTSWCIASGYLPTTNESLNSTEYQQYATTNDIANMYVNGEFDLYSPAIYSKQADVLEAIKVMMETAADKPETDVNQLLLDTQDQIDAIMSR